MIRSPVIARFTGPAVSIREGRRVVRIIPRVLLTLAVLALGGFVLLVLIGLWDRYEKETAALGFSGIYERYVAWQAGSSRKRRSAPEPRARGKRRFLKSKMCQRGCSR